MNLLNLNYNLAFLLLEGNLGSYSKENTEADFVELIEDFQGRLYGYILSLISNPNIANDILQETNMVLWRKSSEFEMGTNFKAWSFRIANFQVMAYREKRNRDRHVYDDTLFEELASEAEEFDESYNDCLSALEGCLQKLNDEDQSLLKRRYSENENIKDIATSLDLKPNSLSQIILRIRKKLMACIKHKTGLF